MGRLAKFQCSHNNMLVTVRSGVVVLIKPSTCRKGTMQNKESFLLHCKQPRNERIPLNPRVYCSSPNLKLKLYKLSDTVQNSHIGHTRGAVTSVWL